MIASPLSLPASSSTMATPRLLTSVTSEYGEEMGDRMGLGVAGAAAKRAAPESALTCHDHSPNRRRSTTLRRPYASLRNRVRDDVPVRKLVQIICPPIAFARPTVRTLSTSKHFRVHRARCAMLDGPRRVAGRRRGSSRVPR
jgi:hypothetical protein